MKKQNNSHELEQQWERAVDQAQENLPREQTLSDEMLDSAAGLEVKSGVRAGGWTHTCTCGGQCLGM